jgi:hypothetical protein
VAEAPAKAGWKEADLELRRKGDEVKVGLARVSAFVKTMADKARPDFGKSGSIVNLQKIEIVPRYQLQITGRRAGDTARAK